MKYTLFDDNGAIKARSHTADELHCLAQLKGYSSYRVVQGTPPITMSRQTYKQIPTIFPKEGVA